MTSSLRSEYKYPAMTNTISRNGFTYHLYSFLLRRGAGTFSVEFYALGYAEAKAEIVATYGEDSIITSSSK